VERIQSYDDNGWSYIDQLHQFVDGDMTNVSFINKVSELVTGAVGSNVPFTGQRWANFHMLLTNLKLKEEQQGSDGVFDFRYRWSGAETRPLNGSFLAAGLLLFVFALE
jgi:hypothetical protein